MLSVVSQKGYNNHYKKANIFSFMFVYVFIFGISKIFLLIFGKHNQHLWFLSFPLNSFWFDFMRGAYSSERWDTKVLRKHQKLLQTGSCQVKNSLLLYSVINTFSSYSTPYWILEMANGETRQVKPCLLSLWQKMTGMGLWWVSNRDRDAIMKFYQAVKAGRKHPSSTVWCYLVS